MYIVRFKGYEHFTIRPRPAKMMFGKPRHRLAYKWLDTVKIDMFENFDPNISCGSRVMSRLKWCSANPRPSKKTVTRASG